MKRLQARQPLVLALLTASSWGCLDSVTRNGSGGDIQEQADAGVAPAEDVGQAPADTGPPDEVDAAPAEPELQGLVFHPDPIANDNIPVQVTLPPPNTADGRLSNEYVMAINCLNEPGGHELGFGGFSVTLCNESQTVRPDDWGNYLELPPADYSDPNDPFTEVQMYFHVNNIHDYFFDKLGVTEMDFQLPAITNAQILFGGGRGGGQRWQPLDNAAYLPAESVREFRGVDSEVGAIMFGQGNEVDFSYDASVIYHEYTHAVVGSERLLQARVDRFGMDNSPAAINEGLADYFATTHLDNPSLGGYGLATFGPALVRDLSELRVCPDNLTTEIHADGKIIGSALWAIRESLGAETTDGIVYRGLTGFSTRTGFEEASQAWLAEAQALGAEEGELVEEVLQAHGLLGCVRAKPWQPFNLALSADQVPYTVPGRQEAGMAGLGEWVPGYVQFYLDFEPGETATLSWEAQGQQQMGPPGRGGETELALALRMGEPVEMVESEGSFSVLADALIPFEATEGERDPTVTLDTGCVSPDGGRVYVAFLNGGGGSGQVTAMNLERRPLGSRGPNAFSCIIPSCASVLDCIQSCDGSSACARDCRTETPEGAFDGAFDKAVDDYFAWTDCAVETDCDPEDPSCLISACPDEAAACDFAP